MPCGSLRSYRAPMCPPQTTGLSLAGHAVSFSPRPRTGSSNPLPSSGESVANSIWAKAVCR
jgi:hypothetical protein